MAAMAGASLWARQSVPAPRATVTVCIESDPHVPMGTRGWASEMFASIGVRIDWHEWNSCPAGAISVHLFYAPLNRQTPKNLGFAESHEGTRIVVFLDRVENLNPTRGPRVLAHVLVHEITHILEGTGRHSATGIMKARWDREDYFAMLRKDLPFAQEDIEMIYDGLGKRQARVATAGKSAVSAAAVAGH
jgi:hypothetical protein